MFLQWRLSHSPLADERFTVKLTIQSSNNTLTIREVYLSCHTICDSTQIASYKLTDIDTNSIYLAEVTVINLYGQSTKIYLFDPEDFVSESIGLLQWTDNCAMFAVPFVVIILLLTFGYVILLIIYLQKCYRKKRSILKLRKLSEPQYIEMSPRGLGTVGYFNAGNELLENPQLNLETNIALIDVLSEPTYAHIDEAGTIVEEVKIDLNCETVEGESAALSTSV